MIYHTLQPVVEQYVRPNLPYYLDDEDLFFEIADAIADFVEELEYYSS